MKNYLTTLAVIISITSYSQTKIKVNIPIPQGKIFNLDTPKDEGTATTKKASYKGKTYIVYATKKGNLFIKLWSDAKNKEYRKYIK